MATRAAAPAVAAVACRARAVAAVGGPHPCGKNSPSGCAVLQSFNVTAGATFGVQL
jgi:hypothetical protein